MNLAAIAVQGPFHLEATVRVLQRRPSNRIDVWEAGRYLRVLAEGHTHVLVEVHNSRTIQEPVLQCTILASSYEIAGTCRRGIEAKLRRILGLDMQPISIRSSLTKELKLHSVAHALHGMRPPRYLDLFEAFMNVVPFQQLSLDAGLAIVGRLVERFGFALEHDGRRLFAAPTAHAVAHADPDELRACGLSNRKSLVLVELAQAIESGQLSEQGIDRMATAEALETLMTLPGIGPWSAALILLRGFRRLEVFPPDDVAAIRTLSALMQLESASALHRVVEHFGPQRGYLYFLGLGTSLFERGLIHSATDSLRAGPD